MRLRVSNLSWRPALAGPALIATLALVPISAQTPQAPTFRATTDAVYVTATVLRPDGALVTDLTEADFEIFDNGEARPITVFRNDPVPFALVVMLDISGSIMYSVPRSGLLPPLFSDLLGLARGGIEALLREFQPGDRANIGTFSTTARVGPHFSADPQTLLSWTTGSMNGMGLPCGSPDTPYEAGPQMRLPASGGSVIWDAIGCGLATVGGDAETPRRVVLVVTDGIDHGSRRSIDNIGMLAAKAGIMVYAVGLVGAEGIGTSDLRQLVEQTGGGFFQLKLNADLPQTFARIAEELRHQYVFGFSPSAVSAASHKVDVRVRRTELKVHARQIYLEDVPINATPGTGAILTKDVPIAGVPEQPITFAPGSPRPLRPIPVGRDPVTGATRAAVAYALDSFEDGEWSSAPPMPIERLLALASDGLKKSAEAWVAELGPADARRRRLAVATYVLHLLDDVSVPAFWQAGQPASSLLEWACAFLRREPALDAERAWHGAAVALLERWVPAAVMTMLVTIGLLAAGPSAQEPVFRGRVDAVTVAVSVRDKTRPVEGLEATDFELTDNGVAQAISSTTVERLPVDLTIVLDTSGSVKGPALDVLKAEIGRMVILLDVDDRVRLITFDTNVRDLFGLRPVSSPMQLDRISGGGHTSFYNALAAAMMLVPDAERPQLVFGFTDGIDTTSFVDLQRLRMLAGYSSAAMYLAVVPPTRRRAPAFLPGRVSRSTGADSSALREITAMTGGLLYDTAPAQGVFRSVLRDFRTGYVLQYQPRGVAPRGWHEIAVKLKVPKNYDVRARKGYQG